MRCISREVAEKLKAGVKKGDFNIEKMFAMTTKERRAIFEKYIPKEEAKFANTQFEKALLSSRKQAMEEWAKETFVGGKKSQLNSVLKRVDEMAEKGILDDKRTFSFLEDFVSEKLGVTVSFEEVEKIMGHTEKLKKLADTKATIATKEGVVELNVPSIDYWKEMRAFGDYVDSLSPTPILKLISKSTQKTTLLTGIKSTFTNIIGNSANAITISLGRRIANMQGFYGGNGDLVKEYFKLANKIYRESGYDISRMKDYNMGRRVWGEKITTSQGPGVFRKVSRVMEDIVFTKLLGAPDVAFSTAHFGDSAAINSLKMAKTQGLKGKEASKAVREYMIDSFSIEPNTSMGERVREYSIKQAEMGTYTDSNLATQITLGFRSLLNKIPGINLGDWLNPFVKIPTNVVLRTIEAAGGLLPKDAFYLMQGIKQSNPEKIQTALNGMARAGVGLTGAWIIYEMTDPENFVGEYAFTSPAERRLIELQGASYNSIKIGDKWISFDYFGGFAAPLVGMMNARKYGKGGLDKLQKYVTGVANQWTRTPGIDGMLTAIEGFHKYTDPLKSVKDNATELGVGIVDTVSTRVIPMIVQDIAKSLDEYERRVGRGSYESAIEGVLSGIPFAREKLDPKRDIFGEPIKTQPWWAVMAFGARFKVGKDSEIINELNRLSAGRQIPSLTNIEYTSSRVKELSEQIGKEEFGSALEFFGKEWNRELVQLLRTRNYQRMSDEDKRAAINKTKNTALERMLKRYHYRKN